LLGEVVGKRHAVVGHKTQNIVGIGTQSLEQIGGLALARAAAFSRRWGAWIGGFALGDDLPVEGAEVGNAFGSQRATCGGDLVHQDPALRQAAGQAFYNRSQFTRYFYRPQPLRTLEEIRADILALERETEGLLGEIIGVNPK